MARVAISSNAHSHNYSNLSANNGKQDAATSEISGIKNTEQTKIQNKCVAVYEKRNQHKQYDMYNHSVQKYRNLRNA